MPKHEGIKCISCDNNQKKKYTNILEVFNEEKNVVRELEMFFVKQTVMRNSVF